MSVPTRLEGDVYVAGNLSCKTLTPPANSVTNLAIPAGAGIDPLKLGHIHHGMYSQPNAAATTETKAIAVIRGAVGIVLGFVAGCIGIPVGAATVTFDLKKNGVTVLSAVITLNSSSVARVVQAATISVTPLAAGDVLEVVAVATASGGTLPTGCFAQVKYSEDPL